MGSIRKQIAIYSGASGIQHTVVSNRAAAYRWIMHNLTEEQQACVKTEETYIKVNQLANVARAK